MIQGMTLNERCAAAVFGAKTEIISDVPPTAISMLAAPSASTWFRNLDQPVPEADIGVMGCRRSAPFIMGFGWQNVFRLYPAFVRQQHAAVQDHRCQQRPNAGT